MRRSSSPAFRSGLVKWIDDPLPVVTFMHHELNEYPTPKNLNYWWNFGSLAGITLVIMLVTGIVLAMHYVAHVDYAFQSVERIMRDVNYGWLIRNIHMNGASFFFIVVYIHLFRGLFYGSYKTPREITWMLGVVILRGFDFDIHSRQTIGIMLGLGATVCFGLSALWATRRLSHAVPLGAATFQLISASLMMLVLSFAVDRRWQLQMPGLVTWAAILGLAALSTALGFIIFFQIIMRSGASNVVLVTLLVPVSALLLGYFILHEQIVAREIAGALVIASALLVMDGRIFRLFRGS